MKNKNYFKKLTLAFLVILGFTNGVHAQVPSYVPADGLVGYWPFTGNANDMSPNANNGTVNGATLTTDRFGNANSAYFYNGSSSHINVPNSASLKFNGGITISTWFNASSIPIGQVNSTSYIMSKGADGGTPYSWTSLLDTNGLWLGIWNNNNQHNGVPVTNSKFPISLNTWYNVVYTFDGAIANAYVNGQLINSVASTYTTFTNTYDLKFGRRHNSGMPYFFNGKLDDIGIWNRALTANEIAALYQGCSKPVVTPITAAIKTGENVTFTTPASANTTYQWQTNPANVGWQNLSDNTTYSGTTTNALTLTNGQAHNNGQSFRVTANATGCSETSEPVTVTISDVCTNYTTVTDLLVINVGTLSTNTPNYKSTITIYPNPAKDQITIDCGTLANVTGYQIKIVNTLGQEVYNTTLNQQQFTILLNSWTGKGLYFVSLYDNNNVLITTRKIELQ